MMSAAAPRRIVIAGAGVAGAILAATLRRVPGRKILCFERSAAGSQEEAGTGLNIGPNAVSALRAYRPDIAERLEACALPWREWRIALTDGREIARIHLADIADDHGLRLRWSELYRVFREPVADEIAFGQEVVAAGPAQNGQRGPLVVEVADLATGARRKIDGVDLLVGADGRFSRVRQCFAGETTWHPLGIANFRLLIHDGASSGIEDYVQYFNGPNRLLAFRVPDGAIYLSATFPIAPGANIPDAQKTATALQALYRPASGQLCAPCKFLVDAIARHHSDIHWSRFSEAPSRFTVASGNVLLLGDAAHPIAATLGQGATQTIEDALVAQEEINKAASIAEAIEAVISRRADRVAAVAALSREASDMLLAGADPIAGARAKLAPAFLNRLAAVYRGSPTPRRDQ